MKDVYEKGGLSALYDGYKFNLLNCGVPAINYTIYESCRAIFRKYVMLTKNRELNSFEFFVLGMIAKFIATIISYPS